MDGKTLRMTGSAVVDSMELASIIAETNKNARRQAFEEAVEMVREMLRMAQRYPGCAIVRHTIEDGLAKLEARAKEE